LHSFAPKETEWQHKKVLELELPPGVGPNSGQCLVSQLWVVSLCQSFAEPGVPKVYSSLWRESIFLISGQIIGQFGKGKNTSLIPLPYFQMCCALIQSNMFEAN